MKIARQRKWTQELISYVKKKNICTTRNEDYWCSQRDRQEQLDTYMYNHTLPWGTRSDQIKIESSSWYQISESFGWPSWFWTPPLANLFLYLTFRDGKWQGLLRVMNMKVKELNKSRELKRNISKFSPQEFLISHALLIFAFHCSDRGCMLWEDPKDNSKYDKAW